MKILAIDYLIRHTIGECSIDSSTLEETINDPASSREYWLTVNHNMTREQQIQLIGVDTQGGIVFVADILPSFLDRFAVNMRTLDDKHDQRIELYKAQLYNDLNRQL